jgi:hypothetical protein
LATDQEIKARRKKLPVFAAHDLRSLIGEAKASQRAGGDLTLLTVFRRHNEAQLNELLRHLGIDPSQPDAWLRGFFFLAHYYQGVGRMAWYPRRANRNAATWTLTADLALLAEVTMLTNQGLSERGAIKKLAADRGKRQLFPYRRQTLRHSAKGTEQQQREANLRSRLQKLKTGARERGLFGLNIEGQSEEPDFYERVLQHLDLAPLTTRAGEKPTPL